jgi:hypothetical protein
MSLDEAPPTWKVWAGSTAVLVLALIATPSEIDNGDICPRPAGWLIVHPVHEASSDDADRDRLCNDAAPKRGLAAVAVALLGTAITVTSRRRQDANEDAEIGVPSA